MKYFVTFLFIALLCINSTEAQTPTYAGLPGPENVLVVYNNQQDSLGIISDSVKNYYQSVREIPNSNIVPLRFPDTTFTIDGVTHTVGLRQGSDIIRDLENDSSQALYVTEHAYKYFYKFVAYPILNYLTQHNLTNQIRYIVLCKGIPMKIQAGGDHPALNGNIGIDFLYQNYPNPFNPVTTIKYAIPKAVDVELKVFDILGREKKTLVNDTKKPGYYEVQFNAGYFASGVYFYRLKAGEYVKTGKMLLLK